MLLEEKVSAEVVLEWAKRVEVEDQELDDQWLHLLILVLGEKKKKKALKASVKHLGLKKRPAFKKTVPMSNFDLLEWCKYLKIPINNVLSRDETVPHNHKLGLFIYNLEPHYMSGSHWVATYAKDNVINYLI